MDWVKKGAGYISSGSNSARRASSRTITGISSIKFNPYSSNTNSPDLKSTSTITTTTTSKRIFGVPLDTEQDPPEIPDIVISCINYFEQTDNNKVEGLFRVPGANDDIERLKQKFDSGESPNLLLEDPHTVASLLKLYFRSLPEPLLTFELYDCFLAASNFESITALRSVLILLPEINLKLIIMLVGLLVSIQNNSSQNKMSSSNLAIVFAPSLLRPPENNNPTIPNVENNGSSINTSKGNTLDTAALFEKAFKDAPQANKLMKMMIDQYDEFLDIGLDSSASTPPNTDQNPSNPNNLNSSSNKLATSSGRIKPKVPERAMRKRLEGTVTIDNSCTLFFLMKSPIVLFKSVTLGTYIYWNDEESSTGTTVSSVNKGGEIDGEEGTEIARGKGGVNIGWKYRHGTDCSSTKECFRGLCVDDHNLIFQFESLFNSQLLFVVSDSFISSLPKSNQNHGGHHNHWKEIKGVKYNLETLFCVEILTEDQVLIKSLYLNKYLSIDKESQSLKFTNLNINSNPTLHPNPTSKLSLPSMNSNASNTYNNNLELMWRVNLKTAIRVKDKEGNVKRERALQSCPWQEAVYANGVAKGLWEMLLIEVTKWGFGVSISRFTVMTGNRLWSIDRTSKTIRPTAKESNDIFEIKRVGMRKGEMLEVKIGVFKDTTTPEERPAKPGEELSEELKVVKKKVMIGEKGEEGDVFVLDVYGRKKAVIGTETM